LALSFIWCFRRILIFGATIKVTMGFWRQIAEYLFIKKRDPNQPRNTYLKYMHGMNRISLLMFIVAVIIILVRLVFIPLFKH